MLNQPWQNETIFMAHCQTLAGLTLSQLAERVRLPIPSHPLQRKGWTGKAMELALGATAKNASAPDILELGIEIKTLPIGPSGKPAESTFVTSIPLLTIHQQSWNTSQCLSKLRRVLWVPVEDDDRIPYLHRRIGSSILWSPAGETMDILAQDWSEFVLLISTGRVSHIDATMGKYLQVRPKALNSRSLCYGFDENGCKIKTMPRGFYLRSSFTALIMNT